MRRRALRQWSLSRSGDREFVLTQTFGAKDRRRLGLGTRDQQRLGRRQLRSISETQARPKIEFLKALRSFCARRAATVIVPSQYLARAVVDWGVPEKKTFVIYNAVELRFMASFHHSAYDSIQTGDGGTTGAVEAN